MHPTEGIQQKPFCDATRNANVGWHSTFPIKLNFKKASAGCDLRFTNNDRILSLCRCSFCGATFRRPDPRLDLISWAGEERPGKARPPKRRYRWRCERPHLKGLIPCCFAEATSTCQPMSREQDLLPLSRSRRLVVPIHPGFDASDDDAGINSMLDMWCITTGVANVSNPCRRGADLDTGPLFSPSPAEPLAAVSRVEGDGACRAA